ncbi:MAG: T9SS type A sorting domain-containing protein [Bacteroidetes bacterium]|nr:T9SS type A sorting domain-containing protein [Bacteroidota bacterium]
MWINGYKITFKYDLNNNLIEELGENWGNENWVNDGKTLRSYDILDRVIEIQTYIWQQNQWIGEYKHSWAYDLQGNLFQELFQLFDETFGWYNYYLTYFYYELVVGIDSKYAILPEDIHLAQNYPNPFNPSTKIKFTIPHVETGYASTVLLKVYDVLGNEIATLINEEKAAGTYEVEFDGTGLPSGIYFYRLQAGSFVETKKMVLIK